MNKLISFLMVGMAFAILNVVSVAALPSTGVDEVDTRTSTDLVACTDADKDREACRGDMAKEAPQSQAGKDINAGSVAPDLVEMKEKGSGKICAAGEDCEVVNFNAELACTDEDTRAACTSAVGDMGGASTGAIGSSPERP
jgi:hypothetical protein